MKVSKVEFDNSDLKEQQPVMAVKSELVFLDHFNRIISERDEDIDIGQLGSSNYEALMLAALDAFRDAMLQGAEPVTTSYKLPPHIYRELVNRLRDTAVKYQGCQQLREQLSRTLQEVIQPAAPQQEVR
ncbi:hypothetical protein CB293_23235 [Salmonella enterica subsp. enterica serovar Kentucky]|nr:hypothetical protein [Salmonella enterica subsp. enterica serovar Kentucky]